MKVIVKLPKGFLFDEISLTEDLFSIKEGFKKNFSMSVDIQLENNDENIKIKEQLLNWLLLGDEELFGELIIKYSETKIIHFNKVFIESISEGDSIDLKFLCSDKS